MHRCSNRLANHVTIKHHELVLVSDLLRKKITTSVSSRLFRHGLYFFIEPCIIIVKSYLRSYQNNTISADVQLTRRHRACIVTMTTDSYLILFLFLRVIHVWIRNSLITMSESCLDSFKWSCSRLQKSQMSIHIKLPLICLQLGNNGNCIFLSIKLAPPVPIWLHI